MSASVSTAICGPYEIVAQSEGSLRERPDGALVLTAEERYLVRIGEGGERDALRGAMTVLDGGREGVLRFGNFVGRAELGGRRLVVQSRRLDAAAVHEMLNEVAAALASLPFSVATPAGAAYVRAREMAPDALYHAYVFRARRDAGPRPIMTYPPRWSASSPARTSRWSLAMRRSSRWGRRAASMPRRSPRSTASRSS